MVAARVEMSEWWEVNEKGMSVAEMKSFLAGRNVSADGCVEKSDFAKLVAHARLAELNAAGGDSGDEAAPRKGSSVWEVADNEDLRLAVEGGGGGGGDRPISVGSSVGSQPGGGAAWQREPHSPSGEGRGEGWGGGEDERAQRQPSMSVETLQAVEKAAAHWKAKVKRRRALGPIVCTGCIPETLQLCNSARARHPQPFVPLQFAPSPTR